MKDFKNWWYYHKWYVICGIVTLIVAVQVIGNAFGLWTKAPDFQIAYVGKTPLPDDTVTALEAAFASISGDFNGDGTVLVQINQYIDGNSEEDLKRQESVRAELEMSEQISDVKLIGDIMEYDSYFFLMDNPEAFQKAYQILALPDGSCPENIDFSIEGKVIAWSDCPLLTDMNLGSYSYRSLGEEVSGDNQSLLSGLYIGRRCFYTEEKSENWEACSNLWDKLAGN